MRTRSDDQRESHGKHAAPGPKPNGPDAKMTVIIDENALKEHMQNNPGYSVRPKQQAQASAADEEEVLVVLPDEIEDADAGDMPTEELVMPRARHGAASNDRAEEVGLLGMDPNAAAAAHIDPASVPVTVNPAMAHEELPNLEVVEDITTLIDSNRPVSLESPDSAASPIVHDRDSVKSTAGFPWFRLVAALALIGCGVYFGPGLYREYVSKQGTKVANANGRKPKPTTPPKVDPATSTGSPQVVTTDPVGQVPPIPPDSTDPAHAGGTATSGSEPSTSTAGPEQLAEFRTWMTGALARNLGAPTVASEEESKP
ncbi:MAG: hypothetical protein ACKVX7_01550 [Planctomycetota bacterium]